MIQNNILRIISVHLVQGNKCIFWKKILRSYLILNNLKSKQITSSSSYMQAAYFSVETFYLYWFSPLTVVHWELEGRFILPLEDGPKVFTTCITNEVSEMLN